MTETQLKAINDTKYLSHFCYTIMKAKQELAKKVETDLGRRVLTEICFDAECRGMYPFRTLFQRYLIQKNMYPNIT